MNINELIVEFLDGTSTPDMDKSMFENLAVNEVAQQKFKRIIEIENSINNSKSYFQPSAESVNQVFSKLGFKKAGMFSSFSFFQTNFVKFSLPSIVGTLLLVFGYNYFVGNQNNTEDKINNYAINSIPDLKNDYVNTENSNLYLNTLNNNNSEFSKQNIIVNKFFGMNENKELIEFNSKNDLISFYNNLIKRSEKSSENVVAIDKSNYINQEYAKIILANSIKHKEQDYNYVLNNYENINNKKELPFSFSVTLSPTIDLNQSNMQPEELSRFNNLGANILYKYSEKLGIGAEIQQETYLQSFSEYDKFDREIIYTQRPNFTNFGVAVDYNVLDKIKLYGGFGTNTNFSGVYSRLRLAREFSGQFPVDFLFGLEYSSLFYNFKQELYNSNKFGIYFGAKL